VKPDETVVLVLTGNLLKDPDFTMEFHRGDLFRDTVNQRDSASLSHCGILPSSSMPL